EVYVVGLGPPAGRSFLQPFRVPLAGGPRRALGRMPLSWRPRPPGGPVTLIPEKITGVQVVGGQLHVATRTEGLYAFPLNGTPPRRVDQASKLPSEGVQAMAHFDGRL